jgi:hypothetical protein
MLLTARVQAAVGCSDTAETPATVTAAAAARGMTAAAAAAAVAVVGQAIMCHPPILLAAPTQALEGYR